MFQKVSNFVCMAILVKSWISLEPVFFTILNMNSIRSLKVLTFQVAFATIQKNMDLNLSSKSFVFDKAKGSVQLLWVTIGNPE